MPPFISDESDGVDVTHLFDLSPAGSWADILPFCFNIQVLNDDADSLANRTASSAPVLIDNLLHNDASSEKGQR